MKARHTVQEVLRQFDSSTIPNPHSRGALSRLVACRTSALGYHQYRCDDDGCSGHHYQYHSCRNRHCPSCNWQKQDEWMEARTRELLPVKYYHTVFTLPRELNALVMGNRRELFKLLFDSASHCLLKLCADPKWLGAVPSITAVLHTWGQQLTFHPHVHCIVSGGGADKHHNWHVMPKSAKYGYLLPYEVMEPVYKGYFLQHLGKKVARGVVRLPPGVHWPDLRDELYQKRWVVYAKPPMGGVSQVVEYLARYAHKVAISNYRILEVTPTQVRFQYKDYQDGRKTKTMSLQVGEFVRRFEQHVLPRGFVKMRHYGLLANNGRGRRMALVMERMGLPPHPPPIKVPFHVRCLERFGVDVLLCPKCQKGQLQLAGVVFPRSRGSPARPNLKFETKAH